MKTSEFKAAIAREEKIIREARNRLSELEHRAITELCPISPGDTLIADSGIRPGREMVAEFISIVTPLLNDNWIFRISGPITGLSENGVAFIPFPED